MITFRPAAREQLRAAGSSLEQVVTKLDKIIMAKFVALVIGSVIVIANLGWTGLGIALLAYFAG